MKISGISNISPIAFGKKVLSKVPVRNIQTREREDMNFVEYDSREDARPIIVATRNWIGWKNLTYAGIIADNIKVYDGWYKYYGIESEDGKIQALCEIEPFNTDDKTISYIVVNPENAYNSPNRQYSMLGASLFKKIVEFAKKNNVENIYLTDNSNGFWDHMPCIKYAGDGDLRKFQRKDYDSCIEKLNAMIQNS